ncbi:MULTISPECIES: class I SAM-dependent methyltransferase [unclassified Oceanobacillus]|uniref:class I SAM-dependent DNA methyltransferase n=1 Tax=unclassified Oceanobacillus TaxID=2630292 RepID=UPI001BE4FA6D|nr:MULTISPECIES: class I SAM-dependent methyltransferase [unclassified Oceanobacillus]MBT2598264.1 class I SAM-dependent methyltransferase [Oceanobacillus sp. ISL-74]MBT2651183.1 class I SAM-dependent methyltransferase [Oceanobacillus sp. ISL-73]
MAYSKMATLYDRLMIDAPYDDWVAVIQEVINSYSNRQVNSIVDFGCGTGVITRKLAVQGYDLTGIDISEDMLELAKKETDPSLSISWLHQDITKLNNIPYMDMAISCCDVVNYIVNPSNLAEFFNSIYRSLNNDGLFLFDVHSLLHIEENYINNTFADVTDAAAYIWFCQPGDREGEMIHELTFFEEDQSGKYERYTETHHQRTFSVEFYKKLLFNSGFNNIQVFADFSFENKINVEEGERIFFLAGKND